MSIGINQIENRELAIDRARGWQPRKLQELGFIGRGRSRHRPRDDESLYGGTYPFIQTGDVKAADLYVTRYSQTYNDKGLAQSKMWEPGTLCITIAANIAETAILGLPACFPDSVVGFVADPDKADARFIKYYIDTIRLRMQNAARGTTQDNLSLDKLLTFDILTPPLPTQRKIAAILSAYDDLIENNTRRIALLEQMARGLYHEWFVRLRFPGHESARLVDSALGPIPEGWEVKDLFELSEITYGFPFQSKLFTTEPVGERVVRIRDIKPNRSETFTTESVDDRFLVRDGDIVIGMDGEFHMGKWAGGRALLNQRVVRLRAKPSIPQYYLFLALETPIKHFESTIVGTTVSHLSDRDLRSIRLRIPDSATLERIGATLDSILQAELNYVARVSNLRQTRDLLLPKLISGAVDVTAMEIAMEPQI